jgi:biotin transporter BioY
VKDDGLHNGISMHRIRVGGGGAGFIAVAGFLCIGLVGIPMLRYFMGFAIIVGAVVAIGLYVVHRWKRSRPPFPSIYP